MRKEIKNFQYGLINKIEEQTIPAGAASDLLNFQTKGDHFELRRGSRIIGTEITGDNTACLGLHVAKKANGSEILFRKRGRKLEYISDPDGTWTEVGSNLFPAGAVADEATFVDYQSLAGDQVFISSPNSSIYKIMMANPGDYADMASTSHRGYIFASQNRLFLVQRKDADKAQDKTGVYISWIDAQVYTDVNNENVGTGDGVAVTFNDTLAFKGGGSKRTCFGITVTDGTETFSDDFNGGLIGSLGGTGTINYMTGVISVTFATAPTNLQAILCSHQWEDSTNNGIADFSYSAPRDAGEGDVFRQDDGGGPAMAVDTYQDIEFCMHQFKTWALTLSNDDTNASNLPYRKQVGIPTWKGRVATGEGIYYVDVTSTSDPKLRLLTLEATSDKVVPKSLSDKVDLSGYDFDHCFVERSGELVIWGCRTQNSTVNNRLIIYDKIWKSIDIIEMYGNFGVSWNGVFYIGDSLSPNVYEVFSGYDDDEAIVTGFYETSLWDLGYPSKLKKVKKLQVEGLIQSNQIIGVYASPDRGPYILLGYIRGDGDYVDRSQSITIGSDTVGRGEIGGGSTASAFHYYRELKLGVGKFLQLKIKFQVETLTEDDTTLEGLGYFSVSTMAYDDVRLKQEKIARRYRIER